MMSSVFIDLQERILELEQMPMHLTKSLIERGKGIINSMRSPLWIGGV